MMIMMIMVENTDWKHLRFAAATHMDVKVTLVVLLVFIGCVVGKNGDQMKIAESNRKENGQKSWQINMKNFNMETIPGDVLKKYIHISSVDLSGNKLKYIGPDDFPHQSQKYLRYINLANNEIYGIHEEAFNNMQNLETLDLSGNKFKDIPIIKAPNLKKIILARNLIKKITPRVMHHYKQLEHLDLYGNKIEIIEQATFAKNKRLLYLDLSKNPLQTIDELGLVGPTSLKHIHLKETMISFLPWIGIAELEHLDIENAVNLFTLPKYSLFTHLKTIEASYSMLCCPFRSKWDDDGRNHNISCKPGPNAFLPCNDIMGTYGLRAISWIVSFICIVGNLFQLLVFFKSSQTTVHKLVMCNFSFSNLLIGLYLFALCCVDARTYGDYYEFTKMWQYDGGCQSVGFLAVFATSLAVCSLLLIAVDRYVILVYAFQADNDTYKFYAKIFISLTWIISFIVALLPATGAVSSYSNTAICLPLEVTNDVSKGFVVWLLITYLLAFLLILLLHARMLTIAKNTQETNDVHVRDKMAKRMAIFIFSNFIFWVPMSIGGLAYLSTRSIFHLNVAKFLILFILPCNACVSPILYGICIKRFRADAQSLLEKSACGDGNSNESRDRAPSYFKSILHGKSRSETKTSMVMHVQPPNESCTFVNERNIEAETDFGSPDPMLVMVDPHHHTRYLQRINDMPDLYKDDRSGSTRGLLEDYRTRSEEPYSKSAETESTAISLKSCEVDII